MDPERLKKVEAIFHAALDLEPAPRAAFLDDACGDDIKIRAEVESLLAFDETRDDFLNEPPLSLAAELFSNGVKQKPMIGRTIGHYTIESLLGVGGMGEVYLAEDARLGRKVALKLLPEEFVDDKDRLSRFVLEAKAISALNHPNIITIHEIGEADGTHFIATEFINGKTLKELLTLSRVDLRTSIDIAIQIASALDEAHSAGIIHRDIKPDNIMIRPSGLVKILDFGIAKLTESAADPFVSASSKAVKRGDTQPGVIVGTADYMSPEQAKGGRVDTRSDIFSFGSVMYEMISGKKAFAGENAIETIGLILKKDAAPLEIVAAEVPPVVASIVDRCLLKNIDDRYQSINDVLTDLKSVRRRLDLDEVGTDLATDPRRSVTDPSRSKTADGSIRTIDTSTARLAGVPDEDNTAVRGRSQTSTSVHFIRRHVLMVAAVVFGLAAVGGILGYYFISESEQIRSIAVMPFVNQSGDANVDYLSDGLTDNLISSLSMIPKLSVKARSTVFTYKGKENLPKRIGEELNVEAVLMGNLAKSGDDLKISLELVNAATQDVLWSASYSRKMNDLVTLQREIARDVSARLRPQLSSEVQKSVAKNYTSNAEAQQLYLKGRFHWNKRTIKSIERAAGYFKQAIGTDSEFALAHAGLADALALMPLYDNLRPSEYKPLAKQSALRALELDPNLAEAHASLGYIINTYEFDWGSAEREYKNAIRLNPNYATAHQWYAEFLACMGRNDEALSEISTALELDPLSLVINRMMGNILGFAGRPDEALAQLKRTVDLYPESPRVRYNLGDAFATLKMYPEAVEQYLAAFELDGKNEQMIGEYRSAFVKKGWDGFWDHHLKTVLSNRQTALDRDPKAYVANANIAFAYAAANDADRAIEFLNKAYEEREPDILTIKSTDAYRFLHGDQRFKDLLRKIGLPE